uniref:Uncharacterized protein n=1 Tax=Alexandrium catenella TaxID=2925 RepID=A0A7S1L6T7_ALECA
MAPAGEAEAEETPQVYDGEPLIKAAKDLKDEGNVSVKQKKYKEAVEKYERGIAILDKADGFPMLRQEVEEMVALKAVLYGNVAQCMLSQELYRRALDAASSCLSLDKDNVKALHRRSLAREALKEYAGALEDAERLQRLGGGSLGAEEVERRVQLMRGKKEAVDKVKAEADAESEDEVDTELVRMKQRFDEVVEKYDLRQGNAAEEVADWLTAGEWLVTIKRVAQRWKMEDQDAEDFLKWIAKGLEFQVQNAANQAQANSAAPAASLAS